MGCQEMMQVVCFSKDRPLQLHGYLTSLRASIRKQVSVRVLTSVAQPYENAYLDRP